MTITARKFIFFLLALAFCGRNGSAQVTAYSTFKVANYHQVDTNPPATLDFPNAYYLGAQLFATNNIDVITNLVFSTPDSTSFPMTGGPAPFAFFYNTFYYPDLDSLDQDFPTGDYQFSATYTNGEFDYGTLSEPDDLFSPSIPYFTGDTWTRMQSVRAALPLTLSWNDFVPAAGSSSSFIFLLISDSSFNTVFSSNFLSSDFTGITVPAYTLSAGTAYVVELLFSDRADQVNFGFDSAAAATAGFDNRTYTSLVTVPPLLQIARGTNTAILSWSVAADNYGLETTFALGGQAIWTTVTNVPTVVSNQNVVVLPAAASAQFFQLHQTNAIVSAVK